MMQTPAALTAPSPAKINLTLRVGPRRPDGYHDLESLVLLLPLCDDVTVEPRGDGKLTLTCDTADVPTDDANLALRAARTLRDAIGRPSPLGGQIHLRKRIPAGMGLGGGSSNAATTLMLLNQLWQARRTGEQLQEIGAAIGSDVPLFFNGPLALMRGRGEIVERVHLRPVGVVLLILPELRVATSAAYSAFDALPPPPGREDGYTLLGRALPGGTPRIAVAALSPRLFNDLQPAAFLVEPRLATLHALLSAACPAPLHMTGSGAGLFSLFPTAAEASAAGAALAAVLDRHAPAPRARMLALPI